MPEYFVDYTKITAKVKTPVLVINGTKDVAIGKDHPTDFKFSNMKIKDIDGSHVLYFEKHTTLMKEIKNFITYFIIYSELFVFNKYLFPPFPHTSKIPKIDFEEFIEISTKSKNLETEGVPSKPITWGGMFCI